MLNLHCSWAIFLYLAKKKKNSSGSIIQFLGVLLPVSAQTIRCTLHQIGPHGCRPRRKPLLKMMHKKAHKQFAEDKQTKDMDYWNHVLWSDEHVSSDGVKRVWRQPVWSTKTSVSCLQ